MTFRRTRCPHCRARLEPGHRIHSECIEPYADEQEAKAKRIAEKQQLMAAKVERAETRRRKETVKTNGQRKAEAQAAVNHWVVHCRDADQPCISCGRFHQGAWHAGHYRTRGSAPHLALDLRNLNKQCAPCNLHLHGNLIEYRKGLVERYGIAHVEELEADQAGRNYSGDDYDAIKKEYRALARQLKKERA